MNAVTEPKHANVYTALCAAQAEMGPLIKGSVNPAFKSKYADLADLTAAVREPLTKHGLAYFHTMEIKGERLEMLTILVHGASDTRIECPVPLIVDRNNMQGMKSATTYAKRIGLESVTGVAPEDDDGNAAAKAPPKPTEAGSALQQAREDAVIDSLPEAASPRQVAEAFAERICADFAGKGMRALNNSWQHWQAHIERFKTAYPDLYAKVGDAYDNRRIELGDEELT